MKPEGKQCRVCGVALVVGENWMAGNARSRNPICSPCEAARKRKYHQENREQIAARHRGYRQENREQIAARHRESYREKRQTPEGRARYLLRSAKGRAKKRGEAFLLTPERVILALENGVCERTGLTFVLDQEWGRTAGRNVNPRAPSLDRIDPNGPYSDENVQVVIWQYNVAKGELPENEFLQFCRRVVRTADKKVAK